MEPTERHLNVIGNFINGYAEGWHMAVKECYRNELDIKYMERKKGRSDFLEQEFGSQKKDVKKFCEAIRRDGYRLTIKDTQENTVEWLNSLLHLTYLYEEIITKRPNIDLKKEKKEMQNLREQTAASRKRSYHDLKNYEQENIKRLNRLTLELAYPQEAPKSGKTNKQATFEWTQGPYYAFAEGDLFYDTPKAYRKWEQALRSVKMACKIVSATPTTIDKNKKLIEGTVKFTIYEPDEKFESLTAVHNYELSQKEFVEFLKTGVVKGSSSG